MKLINRATLRSMLLNVTNTTIISMVAVTAPSMRAKNDMGAENPFKAGRTLKDGFTIEKINKLNGSIAGRYDRIVENRLAKEIATKRVAEGLPPLSDTEMTAEVRNTFVQGTSWHRPIMSADGPTCLSVKKTESDDSEAYLRFVVRSTGDAEYLTARGEVVADYLVEPYLTPKTEYANQGLDAPVVFVCYKLASIVEIAIGGERYRIIDNLVDMPEPKALKVWSIAEQYLSGDRKLSNV